MFVSVLVNRLDDSTAFVPISSAQSLSLRHFTKKIALRSSEDDENRLSDEELEAAMGDWDDRIARFNTVHLSGRIGNDPEIRYLDSGKVVLNLSLASTRKYHSLARKAEGVEWGQEPTDWYMLEIWGQTAEYVAKFVDKGARVSVIGSLQVDSWIDKETQEKREAVKVIVQDFDFLESRMEADARRENKRRGPSFYDESDEADQEWSQSSSSSSSFF